MIRYYINGGQYDFKMGSDAPSFLSVTITFLQPNKALVGKNYDHNYSKKLRLQVIYEFKDAKAGLYFFL